MAPLQHTLALGFALSLLVHAAFSVGGSVVLKKNAASAPRTPPPLLAQLKIPAPAPIPLSLPPQAQPTITPQPEPKPSVINPTTPLIAKAAATPSPKPSAKRKIESKPNPKPNPAPKPVKKSKPLADDWQSQIQRQFDKQHARGDFYPAAAIAQGLEGEVLVYLMLNPQGAVIAARVEKRSGHRLLDDAALKAVRALQSIPADAPRETILPVLFRLRD